MEDEIGRMIQVKNQYQKKVENLEARIEKAKADGRPYSHYESQLQVPKARLMYLEALLETKTKK